MASNTQAAFPIVPYADPRAAIRWLERAFGAEATVVSPPDPAEPLAHAEVRVGSGVVMLANAARADRGPFALDGPIVLYIVVEDPDGLHERATREGAEIVQGLTDQDYGSREFAVRDPGGNVWSFGTYQPG